MREASAGKPAAREPGAGESRAAEPRRSEIAAQEGCILAIQVRPVHIGKDRIFDRRTFAQQRRELRLIQSERDGQLSGGRATSTQPSMRQVPSASCSIT